MLLSDGVGALPTAALVDVEEPLDEPWLSRVVCGCAWDFVDTAGLGLRRLSSAGDTLAST